MEACNQISAAAVWMRGKRASPKERLVCPPCGQWLCREGLGDMVPVEAAVLTYNGDVARAEVCVPECLPGTASISAVWYS
jgi:hypothetical protein